MDVKAYRPLPVAKAILENVEEIEITRCMIRWEGSVYQLKNLTGMSVRKYNCQPFSWLMFWSLIMVGLATLIFVIGAVFIGLAFYLLIKHHQEPKIHGLELAFNSGQRYVFHSHDQEFLHRIVDQFDHMLNTPATVRMRADFRRQAINFPNHWPYRTGDDDHGNSNVTPLAPADDS